MGKVAEAERGLAGVQSGKGTSDDKSLTEKLADARGAVNTAAAEEKAAQLKAAHLEKELTGQRKMLAAKEKEGASAATELSTKGAAVERAAQAMSALGFDPADAQRLSASRQATASAVRQAQDATDRLRAQLGGVEFQYTNPEANFDRSRVKGRVVKLLELKDSTTATALEVVAGGKLWQVVVDSDATSKALIDKGRLRQRATIIPLNRIQYRTPTDTQLGAAAKASGGDARSALSLVGYEEDVANAIKYVFGGAFVASTSAHAKAVAFDRNVQMRCVTLEGDLFDPSGTLTGGSRAAGASVLATMHALSEAEGELQRLKGELASLDERWRATEQRGKEHAKLEQAHDMAVHALRLARDRLAASEAAQLAEAVRSGEEGLAAAKAAAGAAKGKASAAVEEASRLEKEIKLFGQERDARLKEAEKALKRARADVADARQKLKARLRMLPALRRLGSIPRSTVARCAAFGFPRISRGCMQGTALSAPARPSLPFSAGQGGEEQGPDRGPRLRRARDRVAGRADRRR